MRSFKYKVHHKDGIPPEKWNDFLRSVYPRRQLLNTTFYGMLDPFLDREISALELSKCINAIKVGKAAGTDDLTGEFLKALTGNWFLYVLAMFNKIFTTEKVPESWSEVSLFMLHKKGNRSDPYNYRGIALVKVVTKLFTQILSNRITTWISSSGVLPEEQAGFRSGRGTSDNIFTLFASVHMNLRRKGSKVYALFIDFRRAFDSIPQALLWNKLYKAGISAKMIRILKGLYDCATVHIRSPFGDSDKYDVSEGVLQGEILSPLLFIIFLSDIVLFFRAQGVRGIDINNVTDLLMLLYADDLVVFAFSPADLRRKLKILQQYCLENGLTVNVEKTKIIVFRASGRLDKHSKVFTLDAKPVVVTNSYTYLGVDFTSSALGLQATRAALARANIASTSVLSILSRAKVDSWAGMTTLYRSVVASTLLYSADIWGLRYLHMLERAQLVFFKRLFVLPKSTAGYALRLELGLHTVACDVLKNAYGWVLRILKMDESRLPRICFMRLVEMAESENSNMSHNWVSQFKQTLAEVESADLWTNLTADYWLSRKNSILEDFNKNVRARDFDRYRRSSSAQFALSRSPDDSFLAVYPARILIVYLRTKMQVRLANVYSRKIVLGRILYAYDPTHACTVCSLNVTETLQHILLHCPMYTSLREQLLESQSASALPQEEVLSNCLITNEFYSLKALHLFFVNSFKLRAATLGERIAVCAPYNE